jgi:UDP:flavonoid glycosyltransferase YjiC (YdhE family)
MKSILFCWELGAGFGHLLRIKPVIIRLMETGCRVVVMTPDIAKTANVLRLEKIQFLQSPIHQTSLAPRIEPMRSFPQILFNHGFGNLHELSAKTNAVRFMLDSVTPELVICDHAPLTLLALRTRNIPKITIGCGFCSPAAHTPFRDLRTWLPSADNQIFADEQAVLQNINQYLVSESQQEISQFGQLYRDVDAAFLATIPELDPYAAWRDFEIYLPPAYENQGETPQWAKSNLKKCFIYLRRHPKLPDILHSLRLLPVSTLVAYIPDCPKELIDAYATDRFKISPVPFQTDKITQEADVAVLNGGINLAVSFLLRGVPLIILPLQLEQTLTARSIQESELGKHIELDHPHPIGVSVHEVLETPKFRENAQNIAQKYQNLLTQNMTDCVTAHILKILTE